MMLKSQNTLCVLVIFCVGITIVVCGKVPIRKRSLVVMGSGEPSDTQMRPNKRTFCNAFTGCGGKRSDASMPPKPDYEYNDRDSMGDNSDDSVDDVARDILAEARLYEALQARNSMRLAQNRRPGFFPRQKRSPSNSLDNYLIAGQKSFSKTNSNNNNKGDSQESSQGTIKSQNIL